MDTSVNVLNQLNELQKYSGKSLNPVVRGYLQDREKPLSLVEMVMVSNGLWKAKPRNGVQSLTNPKNRQAIRRVKTLSAGKEQLINELNTNLLGGVSYPVLTAVLGTAAGIASGGAGLLFTAATTGLSLKNTVQRVLARTGDEIWQVEEIGKSGKTAVYVSSYFIVDPYRFQTQSKGWLIDERRIDVLLD